MRKARFYTILLFILIILDSCSNRESTIIHDLTTNPLSSQQMTVPTPKAPHDEYMALVESYIDGAKFVDMNVEQTEELSDLLQGHYDVIGRTAGDNLNYYLAIRREDAPSYNDFETLDISFLSGPNTNGYIIKIGYYDHDSNSTLLYEVDGYRLLESNNLNTICFGLIDEDNNDSFDLAFTETGRDQLNFIRKNGLSFYSDTTPSIKFYYHNHDTMKFYSTPFSCYIHLTNDEVKEIQQSLPFSIIEDDITSKSDALKYLQNNSDTICTTGAKLHVGDQSYVLLGNKDTAGYMMTYKDNEKRFISLEYNESIYQFVMEKIQDTIGMDYGNFDGNWFDVALKSASIQFPERIDQADGSTVIDIRTQTVDEPDKLATLSKLMDLSINNSEVYDFSGCPYIATIDFVREDDETLRMFIATDSCDSMAYEGRIGFEYGNQSDMAEIFNEAMAYRLLE